MSYQPWSIGRVGARAWLSLAILACVAGTLWLAHNYHDRIDEGLRKYSSSWDDGSPVPPNGRSNPIRILFGSIRDGTETRQEKLARLNNVQTRPERIETTTEGELEAEQPEAGNTIDPTDLVGLAIRQANEGKPQTEKASPPPVRRIAGIKVMAVDFDLSGQRPADGSLEIAKPMVLDGRAVGKAVIRIEGEKRLFLRSDAVNLVIAKASAGKDTGKLESLSEEYAFVSWERLRETGIDVKYDPINDRILVRSLS